MLGDKFKDNVCQFSMEMFYSFGACESHLKKKVVVGIVFELHILLNS